MSGIAPTEYGARRAACAELVHQQRLGAVVVTDPSDLRYLIGHSGVTELGASPFSGPVGVALVVAADGSCIFVAGEPDASLVALDAAKVATLTYATFTDLTALRPRTRLATGVAAALAQLGIAGNATVGIEASSLPASVLTALQVVRPRGRFVDVDSLIERLRLRKSPGEIALIRRCVELCDAAQLAVASQARAGMTRADVLDLARAVVERAVAGPVPIVLEVEYGSEAEGAGIHRELRDGDVLLIDIAPQLDGYWGDSCDTRFVGERRPPERAIMKTVEEALTLGTEAARPGVTADQLDALMRNHVGSRYPPYSGKGGHGVGLDYHETPRLIPGETVVLEPGMVIALEPAVYLETTSTRLEHLVLIVPGGCEVLSGHLAWHQLS